MQLVPIFKAALTVHVLTDTMVMASKVTAQRLMNVRLVTTNVTLMLLGITCLVLRIALAMRVMLVSMVIVLMSTSAISA